MPQPASADPPSGRAAKRCSDAYYVPSSLFGGRCLCNGLGEAASPKGALSPPAAKTGRHSARPRDISGRSHDNAFRAARRRTAGRLPQRGPDRAAQTDPSTLCARPAERAVEPQRADPPRGRHRDRPRHPGDRWAPGIPDAAYASDDGGAGPRSCDGVPRHRGCCRRYQATAGHIETRSSDACGDRPRPVGGGTAPTRDSAHC